MNLVLAVLGIILHHVFFKFICCCSMEKSRTDQLLKVSQKAASSALASMDVNHTHMEGDHTHQGTGNSVQVRHVCSTHACQMVTRVLGDGSRSS